MLFDFLKQANINDGVEDFSHTDGAILLDVRTEDEYNSGHVPESINIDVAEINEAVVRINDKNTPLFVYCQSGARSTSASEQLKKMGYKNVNNIGGIMSYTGAIERG